MYSGISDSFRSLRAFCPGQVPDQGVQRRGGRKAARYGACQDHMAAASGKYPCALSGRGDRTGENFCFYDIPYTG